jgi:hypothetical protein
MGVHRCPSQMKTGARRHTSQFKTGAQMVVLSSLAILVLPFLELVQCCQGRGRKERVAAANIARDPSRLVGH